MNASDSAAAADSAAEADALALGLSAQEYQRICAALQRTPNAVERAIFSVMWSEHCSYKSSRVHLARLPSRAPHVIYGPGENAGAVDIGDGLAAVFKIESHNHPSFIEPYQGAATGVGGILRDVFCMGARPVALLNALRFGAPEHKKTRALLAGAVAGIGDYGNCVGVPTVGGELGFEARCNDNILVNAMCVGLAQRDRIFTARPRTRGGTVVYVGAKTGRDGIHGATMASAEFSAADDGDAAGSAQTKRPTVQIGDPFYEKLLLEACLELLAEDAVDALQDMGAAGLTSSAVEMASKGGLGIELELARVPCRDRGMQPIEILLSESQERMLMIIAPRKLARARKIFAHWGLAYAEIGRLTARKEFCVRMDGRTAARLPLSALVEDAPALRRAHVRPKPPPRISVRAAPGASLASTLRRLIGALPLASRRWVWEQYDSTVMGDTLAGAGGDAAVVRVHGTERALALSCDSTPRYCAAEPRVGGQQAIAENWRNLTAVGARPLAWTNCLNFGNPERPEIMGEFLLCLEGMREAALALSYPVVSGNVSFYNETDGRGIPPAPVIGGVGLLERSAVRAACTLSAGDVVYLVGATQGELGCSLYAQLIARRTRMGAPPPVALAEEKRLGDFVRTQIRRHGLRHVHDVSDGGALVALAEMALAGNVGVDLSAFAPPIAPVAFWFGEDQARYLAGVPPKHDAAWRRACTKAAIPYVRLGEAGGNILTLPRNQHISIASLRKAHERALPDYMAR